MIKKILGLILVFSAMLAAQGASFRGAFPDLVPEARGAALGDAAVAMVGDINATIWNPAAMTFTTQKGVVGAVNKFQQWPIYLGMFGYVQGMGTRSASALIWKFLTLKAYDGEARYQEHTISYAWATQIMPSLGIGIRGKYLMVNSKFNNEFTGGNAQGFSFDIGATAYGLFGYLNIGLVFKDLGSIIKWQTGRTEKLPPVMEFGISTLPIIDRFSFLAAMRAEQGIGLSELKGGMEIWIFPDIMALRMGAIDNLLNKEVHYTVGLGILTGDIFHAYFVNYAYEVNPNEVVGPRHRLSVGLLWQ